MFGDTNGVRDIFVRDRLEPLAGLQVQRVSVTSAGAQATGGGSDRPRVSDTGRYVAFESSATNLVAGDTNGVRDIFVRDRTANVTTRMSVSSTGEQSSEVSFGAALSGNGERVVFTSSEILTPADGNDLPDVYGRPVTGGTTGRDSVGPGGVEAQGGSGGATISADGTLVAFTTNAANLSALDTNVATTCMCGTARRAPCGWSACRAGRPPFGRSMPRSAPVAVRSPLRPNRSARSRQQVWSQAPHELRRPSKCPPHCGAVGGPVEHQPFAGGRAGRSDDGGADPRNGPVGTTKVLFGGTPPRD